MKNCPYYNTIVDKHELKRLIAWAFRDHGVASATNMADNLKDLGFKYATKAGFSLSLEDLRIPPRKKSLLNRTLSNVQSAEQNYVRGEITAVERLQKVIDTWNNASEALKSEVMRYFKESDPLNPVYIMAFSGARGNISQVRQLVGMRGLMADPAGQIIDLPIASNFREGLTVTEYFISSYGARKGLVDTALRTADSGYLTRRLVDVAQDVIIRESNCQTERGIPINFPSIPQMLGRVLVENIYHPISGALIAQVNQDINANLAEEISLAQVKKILVRSPLTCASSHSICQHCYGWSLAHDRLVDLGEAVGIIAAQSIGEPGTQLTMRTFHTGGVFTGEVAKQINVSNKGVVCISKEFKKQPIRTRHGDEAQTLLESIEVLIKDNSSKILQRIYLPEGSTLFAQDSQMIEQNDTIAELPINSRLGKEKAYKQIVSDISGQICFTDLKIEKTKKKQQVKRISRDGGLIWVLSGQVYNIPDHAEIIVQKNDFIEKGDTIAQIKVMNKHAGKIYLPEKNNCQQHIQEIYVVTESILLTKLKVSRSILNGVQTYLIETSHQEKFVIRNFVDQRLHNYQVVADLLSTTYKTHTGGMIKYLDLPIEKYTISNQETFKVKGGGYILWVEEETHEINKDLSLLMVKHGEMVEAGTEIVKNVFSKNSGIVQIIQKDDIIRELIIKPGRLIALEGQNSLKKKQRGFLRPGEVLSDIFTADNIVYWEHIKIAKESFVLIRPVAVYSVPDFVPSLEKEFCENTLSNVQLKVIRNICFKDGERVKAVGGVELVKTQLVATVQPLSSGLSANLEFISMNNQAHLFQMKISIFENLAIDSKAYSRNHNQLTSILVSQGQSVPAGAVIGKIEIVSQEKGQIQIVSQAPQKNKRILILTESNLRKIKIGPITHNFQKYQWVRFGDKVLSSPDFTLPCSGQIQEISEKYFTIHIARPYLLSPSAILHVDDEDLIQKGDTLAGLMYETVKTGDIVQGLPRIEEILEVRKKTERTSNPHNLLEDRFAKYSSAKLSIHDAVRLSLQEVQLFLIEAIQAVYKSQGVEIADKHIEIIVRQMSSKVKIKKGGDTGYLPGDLVEIQKIERHNETILAINKEPASYSPLLLGITKASLNTESFISAASFQETTKVLTEAAINGKLDWLKGLKENVIIGRLIPAGTGFDSYSKKTISSNNSSYNGVKTYQSLGHKKDNYYTGKIHAPDDIILDDRSAKTYPFDKYE